MPMANITHFRSQKQTEMEDDIRQRDARRNLRAAIKESTNLTVVSSSGA